MDGQLNEVMNFGCSNLTNKHCTELYTASGNHWSRLKPKKTFIALRDFGEPG